MKRGALETAAAWPAWDVAVAGMEAFLTGVAHTADDPATLRADLLQVVRAALDLEGPLRVAREQDRQAWYLEYPSWTLLRIAKRVAQASARRLFGARAESPGPAPVEPTATAPLPVPRRAAAPGSARPRVCFVGDPARHGAHVPLDGTVLDAHFVAAPAGLDAGALAAIRDVVPDYTVVFVPERLTPAARAAIPGVVVGMVTTDLTPEAEAALRQTFPLTPGTTSASVLVHPDVEAQARLLAGGVNAVAAFLPPVDAAFVAAEDDAWDARAVPVLVLADAEPTMPAVRRRLRTRGDVLELVAVPAETMLAPLVRSARLVVHVTADRGPFLAAKVMRDLAAGCLVVAPRLRVDHGLIAGEHYLMYEREEEVERVVTLACLTPERFAVVRRVGHELALRFAPAHRWLDLFAQLAPPVAAAASGGVP